MPRRFDGVYARERRTLLVSDVFFSRAFAAAAAATAAAIRPQIIGRRCGRRGYNFACKGSGVKLFYRGAQDIEFSR